MPRLARIALAVSAIVGLFAIAIVGPRALERDEALLDRLMAENKAAHDRMDAFDLRLRLVADRAVRSFCAGCLPSARGEAVAKRPVKVTRLVPHRARQRSRWSRLARTGPKPALAGSIGLRPAFTSLHRPPREASALPQD